MGYVKHCPENTLLHIIYQHNLLTLLGKLSMILEQFWYSSWIFHVVSSDQLQTVFSVNWGTLTVLINSTITIIRVGNTAENMLYRINIHVECSNVLKIHERDNDWRKTTAISTKISVRGLHRFVVTIERPNTKLQIQFWMELTGHDYVIKSCSHK